MGINEKSVFYASSRLAASTLLLQLLGFFYRILLGRLAGAQAMALYGLVLSAYNVVLAVTLSGLSFSVSRIAARYEALGSGGSVKALIRFSLGLFLGLFGLLALPFLAFRQGFAQIILGDSATAPALLLLVPCLFLTGFENVHKAYFYGSGRTTAPIISETLELCCRIGAVLLLFRRFPQEEPDRAAALILLAMVLSELCSASFLTLCYRLQPWDNAGRDDIPHRQILKDLGAMALPVTLSTLLSRLLHAASTILIPRILQLSGMAPLEAMEQFGRLFGRTLPLVTLPMALFQPLLTVLTPRFTAAYALGNWKEIRRKAAKSLHVAGLLGLPCLFLLVGFGEPLAELFYKDPEAARWLLPLGLNTYLSFLYVVCESVLEGIGQQKRSAALAVGATALGVGLTVLLGGGLRLGMKGFLLGELCSSAFGVFLSLLWLRRYSGLHFRWGNWLGKPLLAASLSFALLRPLYLSLSGSVATLLLLLFAGSLFVLIYSLLLRLLGLDYSRYIHGLLTD